MISQVPAQSIGHCPGCVPDVIVVEQGGVEDIECCSHEKLREEANWPPLFNRRGDWIRTSDPPALRGMRYRASLQRRATDKFEDAFTIFPSLDLHLPA